MKITQSDISNSFLPDKLDIERFSEELLSVNLTDHHDFISNIIGVLINFPRNSYFEVMHPDVSIVIWSNDKTIRITMEDNENESNKESGTFYRSYEDNAETRDFIGTAITQFIMQTMERWRS